MNDAKDKVFIFSRETNVITSGFTTPSRDRFCCASVETVDSPIANKFI